MTHEEIIKDIRKHCRLAMDGMKSRSMSNFGLDYKLNFGLLIRQIEDIAHKYEQNAELAEKLWKATTRELVIVSTFMYPRHEFTVERANAWVKEIPNQEIREQVCINLFQELDYANQIAIDWTNSDDEEVRKTGYWLLARLLLSKKYQGDLSIDYFKTIWEDISSDDIFLRNASLLALKHIGRQRKEDADEILSKVEKLKSSSNPLEEEAYNSLAFEFDFIWN